MGAVLRVLVLGLPRTITRSSFCGERKSWRSQVAYNIADLVEHGVDAFGERIAIACGDEQLTYAELEERANRLAHHLAAHGVGAGSHVGLCTRNRPEALVAMVAVYKL